MFAGGLPAILSRAFQKHVLAAVDNWPQLALAAAYGCPDGVSNSLATESPDWTLAMENQRVASTSVLRKFVSLAGGRLGSQVAGLLRVIMRSEERRVGKECRSRWAPYQ